MSNKEYRLLNILFVAFLLILFTTAIFYNSENTLVSCQVLEITGKPCKSCGLTRDFVSFARLDFSLPVNDQSIFVFLWFALQLFVRFLLVLFASYIKPVLMRYDVLLTILSGLVVFAPFWL